MKCRLSQLDIQHYEMPTQSIGHPEINFSAISSKIFSFKERNPFESVVCKMATFLIRPRCVKRCWSLENHGSNKLLKDISQLQTWFYQDHIYINADTMGMVSKTITVTS